MHTHTHTGTHRWLPKTAETLGAEGTEALRGQSLCRIVRQWCSCCPGPLLVQPQRRLPGPCRRRFASSCAPCWITLLRNAATVPAELGPTGGAWSQHSSPSMRPLGRPRVLPGWISSWSLLRCHLLSEPPLDTLFKIVSSTTPLPCSQPACLRHSSA